MARRSGLLSVTAMIALLACAPAVAQQTVAADALVDSVGVNLHLHYNDTPYFTQFSLIRNRLIELGVRHVRDGLVDQALPQYYERFTALGDVGIKGTFIAGVNQTPEVWASFPGRVGKAFEAFEAPNEYDRSNDANWAQTLTTTLTRMRGLKNDARAAAFPLYGPSLTSEAAYAALGDVSALFDFANMHNYFAGRHPGTTGWGANGYGSIAWNLNLTGRYAGGKPLVTTETGYQTDTSADAVPERIAGRYMPPLLLEQYRAGIVRTFVYELLDWPGSGGWGLLKADGSPKPAFTAVKGLLTLLADPGPELRTAELRYSVQGGGSELRHMAFQKRNGTYFLALWLSIPSWDPAKKQPSGTNSQQVMVRLPSAMRVVRTHRWQPDGSVLSVATSSTAASLPVSVNDALVMIELAPASTPH
jgi:hypothetical protein